MVAGNFLGIRGELERVLAGHLGIDFLERAGFDERMDAFARADRKMMMAMRADFQVLVEFLVIKHRGAFRAFDPKAFGNFFFARFGGGEFRFFNEAAVGIRRGRGDGGFDTVHAERFFCEGGSRHFVCHSLGLVLRLAGRRGLWKNVGLR